MKKFFRHLTLVLGLVFSSSLLFPQIAMAYIDPGTGSYFLQMLLAFLLGASFAIKLYWKKIRTFFSKLFSKRDKDEENDKK